MTPDQAFRIKALGWPDGSGLTLDEDVLEATLNVIEGIRFSRNLTGREYVEWMRSGLGPTELDYAIMRRHFFTEAGARMVFKQIMDPVQLVDETEGGEQDE